MAKSRRFSRMEVYGDEEKLDRASVHAFPMGKAQWGLVPANGEFPTDSYCGGNCSKPIEAGQLVLVLPSLTQSVHAGDVAIHYDCMKDLFFGERGPQAFVTEQIAEIRGKYLRTG